MTSFPSATTACQLEDASVALRPSDGGAPGQQHPGSLSHRSEGRCPPGQILPKKCFPEAVGKTWPQSLTGLVEIPKVPLTSCVTVGQLVILCDLSLLICKMGILIPLRALRMK